MTIQSLQSKVSKYCAHSVVVKDEKGQRVNQGSPFPVWNAAEDGQDGPCHLNIGSKRRLHSHIRCCRVTSRAFHHFIQTLNGAKSLIPTRSIQFNRKKCHVQRVHTPALAYQLTVFFFFPSPSRFWTVVISIKLSFFSFFCLFVLSTHGTEQYPPHALPPPCSSFPRRSVWPWLSLSQSPGVWRIFSTSSSKAHCTPSLVFALASE